jgi:hypothetical protein
MILEERLASLEVESQLGQAQPVWSGDASQSLLFSCRVPKRAASFALAAASLYKLWLDGALYGSGPARAPLGFARVDSFRLPENASSAVLEVAAFSTENFYMPKQRPFLLAAFFDA